MHLTHYISMVWQTISTVSTFFMAMALFPDVQQKAQAEIDAVTRGERLPDFADREKLPYVECIMKETMRSVCADRLERTALTRPFSISHSDALI